ncbi:MAG: S-methyl-5-thioribose-1-phosphate isomerase [Gemmataceae bacterium]
MKLARAIEWVGGPDGFLRLLDQTRLPTEVVYRDCRTLEDVREAICCLAVRGAPAIGVSAAYGLVLWLQEDEGARLDAAVERLGSSRPTAVNLAWALDRMRRRWHGHAGGDPARWMLSEAHAIAAEDEAMCAAIGRHGAALLQDGQGVLTHCNTGALATAGMGTALAVIFAAAAQGKRLCVFANETRPLLQGARLTAWELSQAGLDVTLICDSMAAQVMKEGRVQAVIVGADRIAANGDTANKIGTYGVAVLARAHGVPFYVAAPSSTFDLSLPDGDGIPIEQRDPERSPGPRHAGRPRRREGLQPGVRRHLRPPHNRGRDREGHHPAGDRGGDPGRRRFSVVRSLSRNPFPHLRSLCWTVRGFGSGTGFAVRRQHM